MHQACVKSAELCSGVNASWCSTGLCIMGNRGDMVPVWYVLCSRVLPTAGCLRTCAVTVRMRYETGAGFSRGLRCVRVVLF